MKSFLFALMGVLPLVALAQDWGGIDSRVSPEMIKKLSEAQACFEKIDQSQLEALQKEATAETDAIRQLCREGSRSDAQKQAVALGRKMIEEPVMKELQVCVTDLQATMPQLAWAELEESESGPTHVCDFPDMS
jgi:hypothetical protein